MSDRGIVYAFIWLDQFKICCSMLSLENFFIWATIITIELLGTLLKLGEFSAYIDQSAAVFLYCLPLNLVCNVFEGGLSQGQS